MVEKQHPLPQQQQGLSEVRPQQGAQVMMPSTPSTSTAIVTQTTTIQPTSVTPQQQGGQSSQVQPQQPTSQQASMANVQAVQITQAQQNQAVSQQNQHPGGPQLTSGTIIVPQSQKSTPQIISTMAQPLQTSVTQQQYPPGHPLQHPQQQTAGQTNEHEPETPGPFPINKVTSRKQGGINT